MKIFNKVLVVAIAVLLLAVAITFGRVRSVGAATTTIDLGTAAPFAILSGTPNITDSPTSAIKGNVGLYPGPGSGIGLLCSQVDGTIYERDNTGPLCFVDNDPLLNQAKQDLTDAFIDAVGRTGSATIVPTELGGTTKTAGVYASDSTTFGITAGQGPLVLDGQGDSSSVFIFEMNADGTGLTVGSGSTVSLINSAQACNVFWRVNTAAINTTAVFKGNILALTSITVADSANIEGRLLARNGNVTLINDIIDVPICEVPPSPPTPPTPPTPAPGSNNLGPNLGLPYTGK